MKATIYNEYARRVATDSSGKVFSPINCKDIAAFLHDKRVEEYMMRSGGPVDRCYQMITAEAKTIVTDKMPFLQRMILIFPRKSTEKSKEKLRRRFGLFIWMILMRISRTRRKKQSLLII